MNKYRSPERTIRDILNRQTSGGEKPGLMRAIRNVAQKSTVQIDPQVDTADKDEIPVADNVPTQQNFAKRAQRKLKIIDNT